MPRSVATMKLRLSPVFVAVVALGSSACATSASTPPAGPEGHGDHGHHHAGAGHHEHGPIGHRFENAQEWTAVFDDPQRDAWQKPDEVVTLLRLASGQAVADIGAGTGYFLPYLSRAVGPTGTVLGIDIEPDMVRHMKERAQKEHLTNVHALQASPDDPRLEAASLDRILIVNTWHHIPDRPEYTRKLVHSLRPGGAVFVVDYTLDSPHGPPRQHRLAPEHVREELENGGLDTSLLDETLPHQYVVMGKKP